MKLTKYHRQAFVNAVMQDVPSINYDELCQKVIEDDMLRVAPAELVRALQNKVVRPYILNGAACWSHKARQVDGSYIQAWTLDLSSITVFAGYEPSDKARVELENLFMAAAKQWLDRSRLKDKLQGAIDGCTTLEKAKKLLPEFVKYLPEEEDPPSKFVPVLTGLVDDLTKLGWPKTPVAA